MKLIEAEWTGYRMAAVPDKAGAVQLQESRRAFYAGAVAMLTLMVESARRNEDVHELISKLDTEIRDFGERVKKGWA